MEATSLVAHRIEKMVVFPEGHLVFHGRYEAWIEKLGHSMSSKKDIDFDRVVYPWSLLTKEWKVRGIKLDLGFRLVLAPRTIVVTFTSPKLGRKTSIH